MQANPYSPPASAIADASNRYGGFVPLRDRLTRAKIAIILAALASFALDVAELAAGDALEGGGASQTVLLIALCGLLLMGMTVLGAIFYGIWLHRAASNVHALGRYMSFTPSRCVTAFFIPFVNLVRPYKVVSELWSASDPEAAPKSGMLGLWWGTWLVSGLFENASGRLTNAAAAGGVGLIGSCLGAVAAMACISIVEEITRRQDRSAARRQDSVA